MVRWPGLEPGTTALKGRCSTDWAIIPPDKFEHDIINIMLFLFFSNPKSNIFTVLTVNFAIEAIAKLPDGDLNTPGPHKTKAISAFKSFLNWVLELPLYYFRNCINRNFAVKLCFLLEFYQIWYIIYNRKQVNLGTILASGSLLSLLNFFVRENIRPAFFISPYWVFGIFVQIRFFPIFYLVSLILGSATRYSKSAIRTPASVKTPAKAKSAICSG